jgi:hypothetical protein
MNERTRGSSRSKKTASRFLLADGKDPVSIVAEIFTVSSKVFSREAGVVAITTKSHFVNDLQSSLPDLFRV